MKKIFILIFLSFSTLLFSNTKEESAQKLCSFTNEVYGVLKNESQLENNKEKDKNISLIIEKFKGYKEDSNPEIAEIAEKFIRSFSVESDNNDYLADAVTDLGRLLKCSVDDEYYRIDTAFLLHREDLNRQVEKIELNLDDQFSIPPNNFHKLMIESLAEQKYDVALYAYLKIAQSRCE